VILRGNYVGHNSQGHYATIYDPSVHLQRAGEAMVEGFNTEHGESGSD